MAASLETTEKLNVFNNRGLFSNHYLTTQIPKTPEWKDDENLQIVFDEINKHYQKNQKSLATYKEVQLEDNFIRPVLRALGHFFGIQGKVADNARVPDYGFFSTDGDREEAYQLQGTQDFYLKAIAVGDAKAWNVSLDKSQISGKGMWDKQNPSYQIDTYLRDTPPVWGLLTNGKLWRLYHESTSNKLDVYYEVDLESLLKSGDMEAFKYFYLFFRFEAFPKFPGDSFLDRTREGSQAYAREIGEELKDNIYRAMQKLAEGFFADPTNGLTRSDEDLKAVQDNSMLLLYRILFISYAESRGLLDTGNRYYHGMSLQEMKKEIATKLDAGDFLAPFSYAYWGKLNSLFDLINEGSESERWKVERKVFYIPAYNGGLFDPAKNTFLTTKHVSDPYLSKALDLLARSEKAMVDYSSLDIKHLGSIYEGLLEYTLTPDLNLLTDRGERKLTGSFYTPDPEVKYIVESTIGPVLAQKKGEWFRAGSGKFADYILSIKVLDLSMGSGHFLVEAVDYLARALVEAWATARKEDAKNKEIAEHDIQWARREVVRKCIYGVDLNPMAVELAKLALWLTTAAANKPQSFLDHHLRCGNSLVGIDLDSLIVLPTPGKAQASLAAFFAAQRKKVIDDLLRKYSEIDSIPDDSLKAVKEKERQFKALMEEERSQRIREVANVKLSTYFGNIVTDEDYDWMCNGIDPGLSPGWGGVRDLDWFKKAQQIAQELRFFHWELEFPEVFILGGFDVVVGNPPYVRQESLGEIKIYLSTHYQVYQGTADLYAYFIEKGISLLSDGGFFSYIVANKWMRANYGMPLRRWLKGQHIERIIDFGDLPVFQEATTYPCIILISKRPPDSSFNATQVKTLLFTNLIKYVNENSYTVDQTRLKDEGWSLADRYAQDLLDKLQKRSISLGEYVSGKIYYGIKTGLTEAFVIDTETRKRLITEDPKSSGVIKLFLAGRDVKRYQPPESDNYIITFPKGWTREMSGGTGDAFSWFKENYPAVFKHLEPFAEKAKKRCDQGEYWWELRACDYYSEFEKSKIIFPDISLRGAFTLDEVGGVYYGMDFSGFHDLLIKNKRKLKAGYNSRGRENKELSEYVRV
ncbi:MAG: Eco57I restriction-modification methylase domain-containing protein [Methanothrix sp.]